MKSFHIIFGILMVALVTVGSDVFAQCCKGSKAAVKSESVETKVAEKPQTQCPVMDRKIDKTFYTDHEGSRIYFCCAHSIELFNKNPEKYLKKMENLGVQLEPTPKKG